MITPGSSSSNQSTATVSSSSSIRHLEVRSQAQKLTQKVHTLAMMNAVSTVRARMRDPSGTSDDEDDFDDEKAQGVFNEWVVSLPLNSRRMLAVMLMETLQKC